jgi:tetratricopeptide (TPR) repeat protein
MLLAALLACSDAVAPEAAEEAEGPPPEVVLTEVRFPVVTVSEGKVAHAPELRGVLTAALELGLADLPGVVPVVAGDGAPLAFRADRAPAARQADARASLRAVGADRFVLAFELCVAGGECVSAEKEAGVEAPWPAVAEALSGAAAGLGVTVPEAVRLAWAAPGSKDAYSELMTGRAAAMYYGLLPPSLAPGDRKADPVARAVFLDPGQPIAQWIRARWEAASTVDGGKASEALAKAQLVRPLSPVFAADQAALLGLTGHPTEALLAWETLVASAPDDPRWWLPLARARLAGGRLVEARETLEGLPAAYAWDPEVAALRVAVAEGLGASGELDPLLARWQAVAASNPEPVRRRIDARVRSGAYADAQALVGVLRDRDPGPATEALDVALLVATGRYDDAAAHAPEELAARIRARASLELNPAVVPEALAVEDPLRPEVEAGAALYAREAGLAQTAAERAIAASPLAAEAHQLRARALEAAGRADEAVAAWTRAWDLDPAAPGGPVQGGRIASTFRYVEAGDRTGEGTAGSPIGPAGPEL